MAVQLPSEVASHAGAILFYSFFCLASSFLLMWLVWVHKERTSYVAILASLTALSTLASTTQQINTIVNWKDVKTAQHANIVANVGNPELNITGASIGLDLPLFYIQYYTYSAESMMVLFWAVELAYSVFQLRRTKYHNLPLGLIAKATGILLPVIQMTVLRTSAAQSSTVGFMILADIIIIGSFFLGCILMLAILVKYIRSRSALLSWNVPYGQSSTAGTHEPPTPHSLSGPTRLRRKNIYDNWLVVRFTIAFVALGLFQLVVFFFQLRAANSNNKANIPEKPDLSASKAKTDFVLFVPGVSGSLLIFIVFGTTRTFREYMLNAFVPRPWRGRFFFRTTNPNHSQSQQQQQQPERKESMLSIRATTTLEQRNEPRTSVSWYGAHPSDEEAGYGEFSPTSSDYSHGGAAAFKLRNMDPAQAGRIDGGRVSGGGHQKKGNDDEWPILAALPPTALSPMPMSRPRDSSR